MVCGADFNAAPDREIGPGAALSYCDPAHFAGPHLLFADHSVASQHGEAYGRSCKQLRFMGLAAPRTCPK